MLTVLSGHPATLSYGDGAKRLRLRPASSSDPSARIPESVEPVHDVVVHPNWRILATIDTAAPGALSAHAEALRHFAFVEVGLPDADRYRGLVERWLDRHDFSAEAKDDLRKRLTDLVHPSITLVRCDLLSPALMERMVRFLSTALGQEAEEAPRHAALVEAFVLHVVPRLSGLDAGAIDALMRELTLAPFRDLSDDILKPIRTRLRQ